MTNTTTTNTKGWGNYTPGKKVAFVDLEPGVIVLVETRLPTVEPVTVRHAVRIVSRSAVSEALAVGHHVDPADHKRSIGRDFNIWEFESRSSEYFTPVAASVPAINRIQAAPSKPSGQSSLEFALELVG